MNTPQVNASGWAQAGRQAGDSFAKIAETTRKYSPRYDELAEVGLKARSTEKQAAIKAESKVRQTEINADAYLDKAKINIDRDESITKSKGTIRKAGMVAAAGAAIGMAIMPDEETEIRPEQLDYGTVEANIKANLEKDKAGLAGVLSKPIGGTVAPSASGGTAGKAPSAPVKGAKGKGGLRLTNFLVEKGYSPVSAAAIAGNAAYESADFTAHEEFEPNAYGTKGAGFLQWTNAGGGNRRSEFEAHAKSQGIDPKSFEASAGYIDAEMKGGRHWTGGMTTEGFKNITDLNKATTTFQNSYLRPADLQGSLSTRQGYAQQFFNEYSAQSK